MKSINKKILFVLVGIFIVLGILFNYNNKTMVESKENNTNMKLGIYIEKDSHYINSENNNIPEYYKYKFNAEMSYCEDLEKNKIKDVLSANFDNSITLTSNKTLYCNIYYDEIFRGTGYELPKSEPNNLNKNQAGMYRYQGSNDEVNNYICFGTSNENECLQNKDKYMYRIIGVTEDGKLELIKMTSLESGMVQWNNVNSTTWNPDVEKNEKLIDSDIKWSESDLFKRLNGLSSNNDNLFIGNTTYDYMKENSEWYNKIADTDWLSGQFYYNADFFKLPTIYEIETGQGESFYKKEVNPYYYNGEIENINEENKYKERRNQDFVNCEKYNNNLVNRVVCYQQIDNQLFDDSVTSKIGLLHIYEFDYAAQKDGFDCFYENVYGNSEKSKICLNNWIANINETEWTMSRYGFTPGEGYDVWVIYGNSFVLSDRVNDYLTVRPVFYLKSGIYFEGKGTESKPYIIKESSATNYIESKTPNGLKLDMLRGGMYRYQGSQTDNIENYICFGTSEKDRCLSNPEKYMYRIIGIEAGSNRIKVIKKETLEETVSWWDDYDDSITFLKSNAFKIITGDKYLNNSEYLPYGWKEKISDNNWIYGDMFSNDELGAKQIGEELYKTETGQKETIWTGYADKNTPGAKEVLVNYDDSPYNGETVYYTDNRGKWHETFNSKISLMYIHDYYLSVGDNIDCCYYEGKETYKKCKLGWMHLSQNDSTVPSPNEWTMSRYGWTPESGYSTAHYIGSDGYPKTSRYIRSYSVRPVFYLNSNIEIMDGSGKENDPFMITN